MGNNSWCILLERQCVEENLAALGIEEVGAKAMNNVQCIKEHLTL